MIMKRKSKTFWLIVVPLIAAAIHLALLCLAACITMSMSYPKGAGSPLWAKRLFVVLIWPYGLLYRCNMLGCWIGIGLSFLWMPAVALGAVKVCMLLKEKDTEQNLGGDAKTSAPQD